MLNVCISVFLLFNIGFLIFLFNKKLHIVDLLWGLAQGVIVLVAFYPYIDEIQFFHKILIVCVASWSLRLFVYLLVRNWGKPDDRRYKELSSNWKGSLALNAYPRIFLVQGVLAFLISLPVIMVSQNISERINVELFWGSICVATFGLVYESIADMQLFLHKNRSPGKRLYGKGLYKYSRHPNYFGEVVFWWGIGAVSLSFGGPIWVLVSPLFLNILIYTFSGVPFHKRSSDDPGFNEWAQNTNAIIPNFLKN